MPSKRHMVITVHGIRTFGDWQRRLERLVRRSNPEIVFYHYNYNYLSALGFLTPPLRRLLVSRFQRQLSGVFRQHQPTRLDIVGHSFGTYLIAWALRRLPPEDGIKVNTIILSGSALKPAFYWPDLIPSRVARVVNDCGSRDGVLLLSQYLSLFTGMAGRVGFVGMNGPEFQNRYSSFGHSGYFLSETGEQTDEYMRRWWLPILLGDGEVEAFDQRPPPTAWQGVGIWLANNSEPVKLAMYLTPLALGILFVGALYVEAELARRRLSGLFDIAAEMERRRQLSQQAKDLVEVMREITTTPLRMADILWLTDQRGMNFFDQQWLTKYGLCFQQVSTAAEATRIFENNRNQFSAVISDFRRPNDPSTGYEFLYAIKKIKDVPFIYYVGNFTKDQAKDAMNQGAKAEVNDPLHLVRETVNAVGAGQSEPTRLELVYDYLKGCR